MNTTDSIEQLDRGLSNLAEVEPPTGMWDRFVARLDAEEAAAPVREKQTARKPVLLRGLALVPSR